MRGERAGEWKWGEKREGNVNGEGRGRREGPPNANSWIHPWSLEVEPFDRSHTTSYYWRSIVTVALSCIVSEIKRDIGRQLRFFHTLLAFSVPVKGVPVEYCHNVCYGKTRMVVLPDGEKNSSICLLVSIQYTNVTKTASHAGHRMARRQGRSCGGSYVQILVVVLVTCCGYWILI